MRTQFDGIGLNDSGSSYKRRVATISPDYRESGHTLARAINACHGLDIPEGVSPGALAELVAAACAAVPLLDGSFNQRERREFLPALIAALAPFKTSD